MPHRTARIPMRDTHQVMMLVALLAAITVHPALAQGNAPADPVEVLRRGSSTKPVEEAARKALPLDKLAGEHRRVAESVLASTTVFRELPTLAFRTDPQVYAFFTSYPDVAVSIWRALEISECRMWQTGPLEYEAEAGDGSYGIVDVLHRSSEHQLVYCKGEYNSPLLLKPIKADALVHVQTRFLRDEAGTTYARHRGCLFVSFPSLTVGAAAKLVSPVHNVIVDRNFHEISAFLHLMSVAMSRDPQWMLRVANNLDGVLEVRKAQLKHLTAQVATTNRQRVLAQQNQSARSSGRGPAPHAPFDADAPGYSTIRDLPRYGARSPMPANAPPRPEPSRTASGGGASTRR